MRLANVPIAHGGRRGEKEKHGTTRGEGGSSHCQFAQQHAGRVGVKGGRLRLEPASGAANEHARGILAAALGGPVKLASGSRGTRCGGCRTASDQVLPRPAWRRDRDLEREAVDPAAREIHN